MITRTLQKVTQARAKKYPILTILGPRQSGKTTLCKMAFPKKPYVSLETPHIREYALADPLGLLKEYPKGAILDEVQRVPNLLSYLQVIVDEHQKSGEFILTGSQNILLMQNITQSLAGRTAILNLFPFSIEEIQTIRKGGSKDLFTTLFTGGYPRIYDKRLNPTDWFADYVATYVERDVRQVLKVGDLLTFQTFLKLCAGRTGQLLNLSALASDCGISHNTAKSWISVLETSFIIFLLRPFHRNLKKRLIKTPKLHFYDSGLLCYLLGIQTPDQLHQHPLRGAIFESWVASEILKSHAYNGLHQDMSFYRDRNGGEIDLILEGGSGMILIESKSGQTLTSDLLSNLENCSKIISERLPSEKLKRVVIYGGELTQNRTGVSVLPWSKVHLIKYSSIQKIFRRKSLTKITNL